MPSGTLRYASAGHPAPLLISGAPGAATEARLLPAKGPILGMLPRTNYIAQSALIAAPCRLYVFSDGAFEIERPDGSMLTFDEFQAALCCPPDDSVPELQRLLDFARDTRGQDVLEDDFSIMKLEFRG
jgi:serine phosphatase RsbU (regulator of sigma subunit)